MSRHSLRAMIVVCTVLANANAWGQSWFDPCCCCPQPVCAQPVAQVCAPPVVVQQYQTVPMTQIQEVRQVVQRPVVETAYVDQPVTEYRQVVEQKTAEVPTVQYQTVTECQTVQRDMGRWVTQYQCNPKMSACQYDSRPDLFGWFNRTGYQMRMAFTPNVVANRVYVPNVVTQQVPTQRQVAIRGTQTVNYQVSRMVPYTTTRRVAVNTTRMVAQEVVNRVPVTVYQTVPVGTATAFGGQYYGGATAFGGTIIGNGTSTAQVPTPATAQVPAPLGRTVNVLPGDGQKPSSGNNGIAPRPNSINGPEDDAMPRRPGTYNDLPVRDDEPMVSRREAPPTTRSAAKPVPQVASSAPTAVRVGRWVARKPAVQSTPVPAFGNEPDTAVAENSKKR